MHIDKTTLAEAAAETRQIRQNSGHRVQISFDPTDGTVLHSYLADDNSVVVYREPIITVCFAAHAMTEQEIADSITFAVERASNEND